MQGKTSKNQCPTSSKLGCNQEFLGILEKGTGCGSGALLLQWIHVRGPEGPSLPHP